MPAEKRGFFLVLEGLPGSGKTTICRMLENLGWKIFPEVATVLGASGIPIGDRGDTSSDYLIFIEETRRLKEIEKSLADGQNIVVDSYFPTDLSFAYARYIRKQSSAYPTCLSLYINAWTTEAIQKPDLYVYLYTPIETAVERQKYRNKKDFTTLNLDLLKNVDAHLRFIHEIFEKDVRSLRIDATKKSAEIVDEILKAAKSR